MWGFQPYNVATTEKNLQITGIIEFKYRATISTIVLAMNREINYWISFSL